VAFLPRHGRDTHFAGELNHRANIYGMKKLGAAWIISVSAVGRCRPASPVRHRVAGPIRGPDEASWSTPFLGAALWRTSRSPERRSARGAFPKRRRGRGARPQRRRLREMEGRPSAARRIAGPTTRGFDHWHDIWASKCAREAEIAYATMAWSPTTIAGRRTKPMSRWR